MTGATDKAIEPLVFSISERWELGEDSYNWRLKDGEIRFRGTGKYAELVTQRIPAMGDGISEFRDALNLIDVWSWRSRYDPEDAGWCVDDGSQWEMRLSISGRTMQSSGHDAYPSMYDPSITTLNRGRFSLLVAALYSCFGIESFIERAAWQKQRRTQQSNPEELPSDTAIKEGASVGWLTKDTNRRK